MPHELYGHAPAHLLEPEYIADLEKQNWPDPTFCGIYLMLSSYLCLEQAAPVSSPAQPSTEAEQLFLLCCINYLEQFIVSSVRAHLK